MTDFIASKRFDTDWINEDTLADSDLCRYASPEILFLFNIHK